MNCTGGVTPQLLTVEKHTGYPQGDRGDSPILLRGR
jgi:hypothetical protein